MRNIVRLAWRFACAVSVTVAFPRAIGAEPPPLAAYGELPGFERAALSPSGQQIAVIATVKGQRLLIFLDSSIGVQNTASVGDLKVRGLEWIGEDSVLLTTSDTEKLGPEFAAHKFEAFRAMIVPRTRGGETRIVFTNDRSIVSAVFGEYGIRNVGGDWIGYFGGVALAPTTAQTFYLSTTHPTLFAVGLARNSPRKLAPPPLIEDSERDWLVDGDGNVAATFDMNRTNGAWTIAGRHGKIIAQGANAAGKAGLVSLGKDGTTLIYSARYGDNEVTRWFEAPLDGSAAPVEILRDVFVDDIFVSRTDGHFMGYVRGGTEPARVFLDPKYQLLSQKIEHALPHLDLALEDWTPDFSRVLARTSGTGDSGTWYLVDLTKMTANAIGKERPQIPPAMVGPVSILPTSPRTACNWMGF